MSFKSIAIAATALIISTSASAAPVTINGTNVSFTFDDASLYGAGVVVGNSLFFQPTDFVALSENGEGSVSASEILNIIVKSITDGYVISDVAMAEEGDYIQNGTAASVAAGGRLGVTSNTTTCGIFSCKDASVFNVGGFADTGGANVAWTGGTTVALGDTVGWGSDTDLSVSFENDLSANTLNVGEKAQIAKKFGAIGLVVNPVPVPAAVWLFGSGLLGLAGIARRKKA